MIPTYKDEPISPGSESSDDVEMQELDGDLEAEQEERLLGDDAEYKVEWHLRAKWVIVGSIFVAVMAFLGIVVFIKLFIVVDHNNDESLDFVQSGPESFRRPASDYVVDPNWNYNAAPKVREYKWKITDIIANPDGVFRPMLTVNGRFPGPMIECNDGDTLVIEVDNQSVNATSIHFHGIFQNGTNWMDGTTGITQCPIAPKRKFRYEFTVNGQSGTYYYHGHQAVQASDGLYGPVVIHSKDEKKLQGIPYATDRVVMLQDYYHDLSSGLLMSSLESGSESSPIPDGALINGMNRRDCSALSDRICDNSTANLPSFDLTANANHRLRVINVGAFAWFQVGIDEHQFAIVEVDGTDIVPSYNTRLMISPAQRYSLVTNTNQTTGDAFWLRARMVSHCWKMPQRPGPEGVEVKAIINYTHGSRPKSTHNALVLPESHNWPQAMEVECRDMVTTSYIPLPLKPAPAVADHSYYMNVNVHIGAWRLQRGFFNASTFRPNLKQPTLHRTVEGLRSLNESFTALSTTNGVNSAAYNPKNDLVIQHAGIKVVDIVVRNYDEGNHPLHLHGHKFWVLGQGHGPFPGYAKLGLKDHGRGVLEGHEGVLDNVIRRDVATLEGFGWMALRFVADNPGVWAFHCHMAWHAEAGMAMQFLSRVDEVKSWEIPTANLELCEADVEELEKGATPKDSIWFGNHG